MQDGLHKNQQAKKTPGSRRQENHKKQLEEEAAGKSRMTNDTRMAERE